MQFKYLVMSLFLVACQAGVVNPGDGTNKNNSDGNKDIDTEEVLTEEAQDVENDIEDLFTDLNEKDEDLLCDDGSENFLCDLGGIEDGLAQVLGQENEERKKRRGKRTKNLGKLAKKLDLSDEQVESMKTIRSNAKEDVREILKAAHAAIKELLSDEQVSALTELREQHRGEGKKGRRGGPGKRGPRPDGEGDADGEEGESEGEGDAAEGEEDPA